MPCWYFEKKEIKNSPSYRDGIDSNTENRYRREGARFIVDAGTKLGLRYDTCATGVVYFHRFYMFHSFKEFPRHVTAACCLFLSGKVEETPKKCKDIIKISQEILKPKQFQVFGKTPLEEVMTLERILLQTIKFDLQTEHPYYYLLKYAKHIKADKEKIQKLVQMSWTFINDSLCTTLSLQWEPEVIGVSLMYLGTRLNKFEVTDWQGKVPGSKQKWWECLVEDLTVDLMEDICHQVLDLYSPANQATTEPGESPPPPPPAQNNNASRTPNSQSGDRKRSQQSTPDPVTPGSAKSMKVEPVHKKTKSTTPQKSNSKGRESSQSARQPSHPQTKQAHTPTGQPVPSATAGSGGQDMYGANPTNPQVPPTSYPQTSTAQGQYPPNASQADFSNYNPYVSSSQFQSSFLSQEGARSLQTIMGTGTQDPKMTQAPTQHPYSGYAQPPPPVAGGPTAIPQSGGQFGIHGASQHYPPGFNPSQYPASAAMPGPPMQTSQPYTQQNVQQQQQQQQQQFQGQAYPQYSQYTNYQQAPPQSQQQPVQSQYQGGGAYSGNPNTPRQQRPNQNAHQRPQGKPSTAISTVRISGR